MAFVLCSELVTPPKLFIDTSHVINISKIRKGEQLQKDKYEAYIFLDKCIREKHFGLILSLASCMEWVDGNASLATALEIASVFDSSQYQLQVDMDTDIYTAELLEECKRLAPLISVPKIPKLRSRIIGKGYHSTLSILSDVPDYIDPTVLLPSVHGNLDERFISAADIAKEVFRFKNENPETYEERVAGYAAATLQDYKSYSSGRKEDPLRWMKEHLRIDRILEHYNPGLDIDSLLERINFELCPAVSLNFKARMQLIKAKKTIDQNDVDDWMCLPIIPYADLVLTDHNFRHYVSHGDRNYDRILTSDPIEAVHILHAWS